MIVLVSTIQIFILVNLTYITVSCFMDTLSSTFLGQKNIIWTVDWFFTYYAYEINAKIKWWSNITPFINSALLFVVVVLCCFFPYLCVLCVLWFLFCFLFFWTNFWMKNPHWHLFLFAFNFLLLLLFVAFFLFVRWRKLDYIMMKHH